MVRSTRYDRHTGHLVYAKGHPQAGQIIWRTKDIEGIYGSKKFRSRRNKGWWGDKEGHARAARKGHRGR